MIVFFFIICRTLTHIWKWLFFFQLLVLLLIWIKVQRHIYTHARARVRTYRYIRISTYTINTTSTKHTHTSNHQLVSHARTSIHVYIYTHTHTHMHTLACSHAQTQHTYTNTFQIYKLLTHRRQWWANIINFSGISKNVISREGWHFNNGVYTLSGRFLINTDTVSCKPSIWIRASSLMLTKQMIFQQIWRYRISHVIHLMIVISWWISMIVYNYKTKDKRNCTLMVLKMFALSLWNDCTPKMV